MGFGQTIYIVVLKMGVR